MHMLPGMPGMPGQQQGVFNSIEYQVMLTLLLSAIALFHTLSSAPTLIPENLGPPHGPLPRIALWTLILHYCSICFASFPQLICP